MLLTIILCVVLVALDQLFKMLATLYLGPGGALTLIPGVLELRYLENTGAAFNIMQGRQILLIVLTSVALLVILGILIFRRPKDKLAYIAFVFFFSGGAGNLIDRIAQGYVVDYINFLFIDFAIFNFADMLVSVGFVLIVIAMVRIELKARKQKESDVQQTQNDIDNIDTIEHKQEESLQDTSLEKPDADESTAAKNGED